VTNDSTIGSDRRKTSEAGENDATALAADPPRRRPGRPPVYDEKWTKVTVVLFDRQITYLDDLTESMRARTGTPISRAQLIRALVDALSEAKIDLSCCASPDAVKSTVLSKLST